MATGTKARAPPKLSCLVEASITMHGHEWVFCVLKSSGVWRSACDERYRLVPWLDFPTPAKVWVVFVGTFTML